MSVGSAAERRGTAAEYFRLRGKLYMYFQTDDGFILFCHSKYLSVSALFLLYLTIYLTIPNHINRIAYRNSFAPCKSLQMLFFQCGFRRYPVLFSHAVTSCVYISVILLHALLIGICRTDQSLFPEAVTNQLHTDGQSLRIRAAGNADTGQSRQVDGDGVDIS